MKSYRDKVAVITGGASGIGYSIAKACCERGMRVLIADWEEKSLAEAKTKLNHPELFAFDCDVSKPEQVEGLAQYAWEKCGAVDLLFNNAGVSGGGSVATTPLQDWNWMLSVNLMGVIHVLHYFLPNMLERNQEAHIVNTASIAGMVSVPDMTPYNVSKHGVVTISESLASELRNAGSPVKVSVLCPSFIQTRIHLAERNRKPQEAGCSPEELKERLRTAGEIYDEFFKDAMTPDALAERVFKDIEAGRFYLFSHPKASRASIERRMKTILEDGTPYIKDATTFPMEHE